MKVWLLFTLVLGFWLLTPSAVEGDPVPNPQSGAKSQESGAESYRLVPGDVVEVTVTPQRSFDRTLTVQPDGKVSYPIVGSLLAAGRTVEELAEQLRVGLIRDLVDPMVVVSLRTLARDGAKSVTLLGAVKATGVYPLKEGTTPAELLAMGGGPTRVAELRRVTITRADKSVVVVDMSQAQRTGRIGDQVVLRAGDIVVVPEGAPATVLVLGEVNRPGPLDLQGEMRLLDAIAQAGGPTAKGDLGRVLLTRTDGALTGGGDDSSVSGASGIGDGQGGKPNAESAAMRVDLQTLLSREDGAGSEVNLLLRSGDRIVVPPVASSERRVYILGRVVRPDVYAIRGEDRLLDALTTAGGAAPDGDITRLVLVRRDAAGKPVPKTVDVRKMMSTGKMEANELLQPGDMLFVPDKHHSSGSIFGKLPLWPFLASFWGAVFR